MLQKNGTDMNKWSLAEANSNSDGKSSFMPALGAIMIMAAVVMAVFQTIAYFKTKDIGLVTLIVVFISAGTALCGLHKLADGKLSNTLAEMPQSPLLNKIEGKIDELSAN